MDNFLQQQLIVADLDQYNFSLDQLVATCVENGLSPAIVHESFSSKEDWRKWRIVFALSEPLEMPFEVKAVTRYVAQVFGGDTAVADSARLLYGTNKGISLVTEDVVDVDDLLEKASGFKQQVVSEGKALFEEHEGDEQELVKKLNMMPRDVSGLFRLIVADVRKWLADPSIKGSGYETIFHCCVHLGVVSLLPGWIIKKWVKEEMAKHDHFSPDHWRHYGDLDAILEESIMWAKSQCKPRF